MKENKIPSLLEIEEYLDLFSKIEKPNVNVLFLRSITIESMESYLKFFLAKEKINSNIVFSNFDSIVSDIMDDGASSILQTTSFKYIVIVSPLISMSSRLYFSLSQMNKREIEDEIQRIIELNSLIIRELRKRTTAKLLWLNHEIVPYPLNSLKNEFQEYSFNQIVNRINLEIQGLVQEDQASVVLDINKIMKLVGHNQFYDWRYFHLAKALYSKETLCYISRDITRVISHGEGKIKKCIVLDCDNTLWGGILGEDGIDQIKIGNEYPGSIYSDFQRRLKSLKHLGVILAICSKNNENDVIQVFQEKKEMELKFEDIVHFSVNWNDKAQNIRSIANKMNIGLDSIVFIDDNDFEINLVKQEIPDVHCIKFETNLYLMDPNNIIQIELFECILGTDGSNEKTEKYLAENRRQELKNTFSNIDSYIKTLGIKLDLLLNEEKQIPRIAELTQKTNQFNLTTKRYTEAEIQEFFKSGKHLTFNISASDSVGNMGTIGLAIIILNENEATIDTFLLSCRALGRKVEDRFLYEIILFLKTKGISKVYSSYIKTEKNMQVESFFDKYGFNVTKSMGNEEKYYEYLMANNFPIDLTLALVNFNYIRR